MTLRDDIEHILISAHHTAGFGRKLSPGDTPIQSDSSPETLALVVQQLVYVVAALEEAVKVLADRIEPPVAI